ncbi:YncE family protein [Streptomyces anthocyanicus]|uniref:hypothetical protein n=1 Tax=Streptomyces anthocyanicus TaxID=68174 RepID=UPI0036401FED
MQTALIPYAHLPRAHHNRQVLTSTVDVFGAAHWLLAERAPQPGGDVLPFDALIVSVHPGGNVELTELSAVRARWPHLDRLPDGGFVVAASRTRRDEDPNQVQVFDALGRETSSFSVGDTIEHLLVDEAGHIWVAHFDENPAGIRRWSATCRLAWTSDGARIPGLFDCYALNVSNTAAWACAYTDFPLVGIRPDRTYQAGGEETGQLVCVTRHRSAEHDAMGCAVRQPPRARSHFHHTHRGPPGHLVQLPQRCTEHLDAVDILRARRGRARTAKPAPARLPPQIHRGVHRRIAGDGIGVNAALTGYGLARGGPLQCGGVKAHACGQLGV